MKNHPLHEKIGKIIFDNLSEKFDIILDPACKFEGFVGASGNIPLFLDVVKHNDTEIANVDLIATKKNNQSVFICEIEESNVKPNHIYGKYLSVALSKGWALKKDNEVNLFKKNIYFLQILSGEKLKEKTKKHFQWKNIEKSINGFNQNSNSNIIQYKIISGKSDHFKKGEEKYNELITFIQNI